MAGSARRPSRATTPDLSPYALAGARVNRVLDIDTETEMVKNDEKANSYLTREYREPYVVPEQV